MQTTISASYAFVKEVNGSLKNVTYEKNGYQLVFMRF